jgi:hypothetical protein
VITPPSSSAHFSPPKVLSFRAPPTAFLGAGRDRTFEFTRSALAGIQFQRGQATVLLRLVETHLPGRPASR